MEDEGVEVIQVSATDGDGSARSLDGVDPPAHPPAAASAAKTPRASPEKKVRAALGCFAIAALDVPLLSCTKATANPHGYNMTRPLAAERTRITSQRSYDPSFPLQLAVRSSSCRTHAFGQSQPLANAALNSLC